MSSEQQSSADRIAEIVRNEWSRVVATLVADLGDLADAEDAVQDAAEEALTAWPREGMPDQPGAWLTVVARRRAIDRRRRRSTGHRKTQLAARLDRVDIDHDMDPDLDDLLDTSLMRDEQLRLIFACCHPALRPDAQVALTLRSVGGLTTAEIARAFVVPETTIAQRLVRAKKKIRAAGIPFKIPPDHELLGRADLVRAVLYLIFNEGYDASGGDDHVRLDLCDEAIRLTALLAELTPDDPETLGLLALCLLIHSRRAARVDRAGELVLLDDQDRRCWDADLIARGTELLDRAVRLGRPGPLQIQAAINALHAETITGERADWEQIELLYRRLTEIDGSAVVRLNHAVAVAMTAGSAAALALLGDPDLADELAGYPHYHAAQGRLLTEQGHTADAIDAYRCALRISASATEQRFLQRRISALG